MLVGFIINLLQKFIGGLKRFLKKLTPSFLLSWYHFVLAVLGVIIYRFPSQNLIVIGITGTNGKSTVVNLVTRIFEEAGYKTASLSSIKFKIDKEEWPNTLKMTMPGRFKLQKFLRDAVNAGCKYAVLEVTSEGIKQWRHWGIDFDVAVLTNLTPEHIESHGSFEKYREAKGKLFKCLKFKLKRGVPPFWRRIPTKVSIVNLDDESKNYFLQFRADKVYGYAIEKPKTKNQKPKTQIKNENIDHKLLITNYELLSSGVNFTLNNMEFNLKLHGLFNIYNALAAICVGMSQGIELKTIKQALEKIDAVSGRFEIMARKPFMVIVDYAHTPDALENVYKTVNSFESTKHSQKICVLGAAGGGRDRWKRPELGRLAAKYCNQIILTNEDPYDEDPEQILKEIKEGIEAQASLKSRKKHKLKILSHQTISDRSEAIGRALAQAKEGDFVIITGKGSEPWMMVGGDKRISWDDRKIVKEELAKLLK